MRIMLLDGAPERAPGGLSERIVEQLSTRFGRNNVAGPKDEGKIDAVAFILDGEDPRAGPASLIEGLHWARSLEVPVVAALAHGATLLNYDSVVAGASALPSVEVGERSSDELIAVLEWLEGEVRTSAPASLALTSKTHRRRRVGDPILLKIAATSTSLGALLWATAGLGPASLFLFLGGVTFLLSRTPPEPVDPSPRLAPRTAPSRPSR